MPPKISVVVPFRDSEEYLAECLESLARQTLRDLEVIMVDGGSDDGGPVVAKEFAGRDDRFTLLPVGGQGLGPARNTGVEHATGQYLAFAHGDDALPPYTYELLIRTLEATGSDLAGGNVLRLEEDRAWQSPPHTEPYATTVKATHITRRPTLLQDRTVGNKVYRRSFWDAHRFEFPAMSFEDPPVSVEAHVLASAVDVLDTAVYFWRSRPGARPDIADRLASLEMVRGILGDHAPALLPVYDRYALDLDVRALIHTLPAASPEDRERLLNAGADIVAAAAPSAIGGLEAIKRLELHLLRERKLPELLEVLRFEENGLHDVPIVGRGRRRQRWYARYPFFGDRGHAIPDHVYDVTGEFHLRAEVDSVGWDAGALLVEGHAHFDRLSVASAKESRIRIWMHDAKTGKEIRLPVERIPCPEATVRSGQSQVSYDWSGFSVRIEPELLQDGDEWPTTTWELFAEVTTAGRKGVRRLTSSEPSVNWAAPRQVDEHVAVQPAADHGFVVHVKRAKAVVTGYRQVGGLLEVMGWTRRALGAGAAIVAARRHGGAEVRGEVTVRPASGMRMEKGTGFDFTATLPLDDLLSDPEAAERGPCAAHLRDAIEWDLRLTGVGGPVRLTVARNLPGARFASRGREFALTRTAYGNLRGVERSFRPVVTSVAWTTDDRLTLTGDLADPAHRPDHLILRRLRSSEEHHLPLTWDGPTFTTTFEPAAMPLFGATVPLASGPWELLAPTGSSNTTRQPTRPQAQQTPDRASTSQVVTPAAIAKSISRTQKRQPTDYPPHQPPTGHASAVLPTRTSRGPITQPIPPQAGVPPQPAPRGAAGGAAVQPPSSGGQVVPPTLAPGIPGRPSARPMPPHGGVAPRVSNGVAPGQGAVRPAGGVPPQPTSSAAAGQSAVQLPNGGGQAGPPTPVSGEPGQAVTQPIAAWGGESPQGPSAAVFGLGAVPSQSGGGQVVPPTFVPRWAGRLINQPTAAPSQVRPQATGVAAAGQGPIQQPGAGDEGVAGTVDVATGHAIREGAGPSAVPNGAPGRGAAGEVAVVVERGVISRLPPWRTVGTQEIEVGVHQTDALQLQSRTALADDERGGYAQRLLWERDYPVYLRSPLTEMVVFDSYGASQYSCNPRAIYEELARSHPGLECVWVSTDGQFTVEGDARTVMSGSRDHYRALARARYIVTNFGLPAGFAKRSGQTYMQTWHGTPLKRMGYDLAEMPYKRTEKVDWIAHEVPRWDVLLSPNALTSDVMRRAFRFDGEIQEIGYPRNDVLSSPDFGRLGQLVRERLGIPAGKKVVLYAPTWRDDLHHSPGRRAFSLELDVETLRRALGGDHVLLVRPHHLITERDRLPVDDFVIDVSRYPDIADLYLAADVLVTDYSSAMVDFACTGRPMLFYTYDLERYRDHVRGLTIDFEAEAPGPLLATSADVVEALLAIDEIQDVYVDAYDTFFDKYCPHDDGKASARAVERLLA
ncbi:CDP-glycerol glycerophosphotransferase family protein [Actinomadura graeca]|uniref:CDP-glycerol glycerophosphotransferase family protein n=1 Tax=Actinomadura graeca TaxID=2750812 RepID=A0ABX8QYK9_9ACTN|nr:CDP-glycerol glycerophosphotransferase family protein [Actinomadura graeca]QXJ23758.1 CDP-glycerol glycerophosphotransferase family protein [Actinomadura graeca]